LISKSRLRPMMGQRFCGH